MAILIVFLPVILILLVANLGEKSSGWKLLTFILIGSTGLFLVLIGVTLLLSRSIPIPPEVSAKIGNLHMAPGGWALLAGGISTLALLPRRPRKTFAIDRLGFHPESSTVHALSLEMALWLIAVSIAQWAIFGSASNLLKEMPSIGIVEITLQGIAEAVVAMVGVGWVVRRNLKETLDRLGFHRIEGWHLLAGLIALGAMYSTNLLYGIAATLFKFGGLGEVGKINEALLGNLLSPWGALAVGISAGIGEEMIFRGAVQERMGVLTAAILFAMLHTQYSFSPGIVVVFVIGLILGYLRKHTSLSISILTHATYNFLGVMLMILAQNLGK